MFADLGHFTALSIRVSVKLKLCYMNEVLLIIVFPSDKFNDALACAACFCIGNLP